MVLKKKHRLVWRIDNTIVLDPYKDYSGTETNVGKGLESFESDMIGDIAQKIVELKLIWKTE